MNDSRRSEKLNLLLAWRDSKISGELFLGLPDRWYENPTWGCENGHISTHYIKSERRGCACPACMKPVVLVPPETTEKQLAEILVMQTGDTIYE